MPLDDSAESTASRLAGPLPQQPKRPQATPESPQGRTGLSEARALTAPHGYKLYCPQETAEPGGGQTFVPRYGLVSRRYRAQIYHPQYTPPSVIPKVLREIGSLKVLWVLLGV